MVTCTAMASGILHRPCQRHSSQRCAQAEQIVGEKIDEHQQPLALLEVGHGLEGETGEGGEGAAEADDHQQAPAGIKQHALSRPDHEEAYNEAAGYVDEQRSV